MHLTLRVLALAALVGACGDNHEGNTPPTVQGLVLTTDEDTSITRSLVISDNEGDPVTLSFSKPAHGLVGMAGADTFSYLPAQDYHGLDSFTVTVSDGNAETTATIELTIAPVNDAPTGTSDELATNEDTAFTTPVSALLANDSDIDGDALTIVSVGQDAHGIASLLGNTITFVPDPDYAGPANFSYVVSDGTAMQSVVVLVTVNPVADPPTAGDDFLATTEDMPLAIPVATLLGNDQDPDGETLTVASVTTGTNGTVALAGSTVTFTPAANFSGTGTFTYTVSDGTLTDTATVFVTIGNANDTPVAGADSVTTAEDTSLVIAQATLLANDTDADAGTTLTVTGVTNPVNGIVGFGGADITFTPTANFHGTGSFQYTVSDGTSSAVGTVTVTITPVNDAPVAIDDVVTLAEDAVATIPAASLTTNDLDIDGGSLSVTAVANATNGTVALAGGTITFTPAANFAGTATFEYTVSDGTLSDTGAVTVVVTAVNDAPVAVDDTATVDEDTALVIPGATLAANDTDVEASALTVTAVSGATHGTVALAGTTVTFTPAANFHGTATFTYTVSDGSATDTGLVTVTVASINDVPVAVADSVTASAGVPTDFAAAAFLANDTDVDLDTLAITAVANAANGATVSLAGTTITFTAPAMFAGITTFEYTVSDGNGGSAIGTVSVGVDVTDICGDGVIGGLETCDDGDTSSGDGCSAACTPEPGFTCAGEPSICTTTCGDGIPAGTEACDDMNTTNGDGCDNNCTVTGCGNGIVTAGEACDDGDTDDTDGCTAACSSGVLCNATAFAGGDRFAVDPLTGSCYVSFDGEQTTFAAARTACTAIGGYLATVTSAAEQTLVRSVQNPAENPWIGALDDANTTDAVFSWVTAEPFTFTAFDAGEPDDDAGLGGNGDCLHLNPNGLWADTNCTLATFVTGRVCEIETQPCGDGVLQAGEQCDDGNVTAGDGCSTTCKLERLFFSEYVEGSSNNKALEIKNPFGYPINLQACTLGIGQNGAATLVNFTLPDAPVAANDVFVICNNGAGSGLAPLCDLLTNSAALLFNGDDALVLGCAGTTLDVIGQVGVDPGTEWGSANTSTADNTIRRKCSVTTGDTNGADAFNPATEWVGFANDTFSGLGNPACAP